MRTNHSLHECSIAEEKEMKMKSFSKIALAAVAILSLGALAACDINDAQVVSENISKEADNFRTPRR